MTDLIDLQLSLAGIGVRGTLDFDCRKEHLLARFGAFQTESLPDDTVDVRVRTAADFAPAHPPRVSYPSSDASIDVDGSVVFRRSSEEVRFWPEARRVEVRARPSGAQLLPVEDPTPLDTPLRLLLSHQLPRRDGMLLHASGYGDARGAVLFAAVSGGGKTTTARKLPPAHVLSDDQIALRREGGEWFAYALPFVGEYRRATVPRRCPLRAIVLLAKGPHPRIERTPRPIALARLLGCTVYFLRADPIVTTLFDRCAELTERVAVYTLTLDRETPVMPWVEELLGAAP